MLCTCTRSFARTNGVEIVRSGMRNAIIRLPFMQLRVIIILIKSSKQCYVFECIFAKKTNTNQMGFIKEKRGRCLLEGRVLQKTSSEREAH